MLLIAALIVCTFPGCSAGTNSDSKSTKLTTANYAQYLNVTADCNSYGISCKVTPATSNYDFNDVEIVVSVSGKYNIYNRIFKGYSSSGVPNYDCTQLYSEKTFNETFTLKLNIGGEVIDKDATVITHTLPSDTTTFGGDCVMEIVSITGTVTRVN